MAQPVYGGDEINAVVLDPGSFYTRIGFAGEDSPKVVAPTTMVRQTNPNYDPEQLPTEGESVEKQYNYYFDDSINRPRENSELVNPMKDGIVSDWDMTQALWDWGLHDRLKVDTTEHPLLITEQTWNTDENRAKAMELAFEHYQSPAFYIVKTPVCALLTSNKGGSGLVVDVGDSVASVTPVIDGLVLYKPSQRSRLAGHFLNAQIGKLCARENIEVVPRFRIKGKSAVGMGEPPSFTKREYDFDVDASFDQYQQNQIYHEFKESQCQVSESTYDDRDVDKREFEFPGGYRQEFDKDRLKTSEALFSPKEHETEGWKMEDDEQPPATEEKDPLLVTDRSTNPFKYEGVTKLMFDSINACDVDIRPNLANNIVITGGTSLVQGFNDRINQELSNELAGLKVRLYAPGNTVERKNAAWVGGSILASLGTFHQLWISKREYEEVGVQKLLEKRFR